MPCTLRILVVVAVFATHLSQPQVGSFALSRSAYTEEEEAVPVYSAVAPSPGLAMAGAEELAKLLAQGREADAGASGCVLPSTVNVSTCITCLLMVLAASITFFKI